MFLETLDIRNNDYLIYSKNMFSFNESFKIIYKKAGIKHPQKITYFEVCKLIKSPTPKNLIVYRMLTNVHGLDAYSTKYGYFIKVNDRMELIYFDPVFALKDLRHLKFDLDHESFRFKIQQLGLTTLTKGKSEADFAEVYSFDMRADEAQFQNDKIFADAIYAFDENFYDEEDEEKISLLREKSVAAQKPDNKVMKEIIDDENANFDIIEDKAGSVEKHFAAPGLKTEKNTLLVREEKVSLLQKALGITETHVDHSMQTNKSANPLSASVNDNKTNEVFDLFKSASKRIELNDRKRDAVILKLKEE